MWVYRDYNDDGLHFVKMYFLCLFLSVICFNTNIMLAVPNHRCTWYEDALIWFSEVPMEKINGLQQSQSRICTKLLRSPIENDMHLLWLGWYFSLQEYCSIFDARFNFSQILEINMHCIGVKMAPSCNKLSRACYMPWNDS